MKTTIVLSMSIAALVLMGCVQTRTSQLTSNTAIISAKGSEFDSQASVMQATLKEAAEVTLRNGYQYFVITESADTTTKNTYTLPAQTQTTGTFTPSQTSGSNRNAGGGTYPSTTTTTPSRQVTYIHPGRDVTVRMYRQNEIDPKQDPNVWDAEDVIATAARR